MGAGNLGSPQLTLQSQWLGEDGDFLNSWLSGHIPLFHTRETDARTKHKGWRRVDGSEISLGMGGVEMTCQKRKWCRYCVC